MGTLTWNHFQWLMNEIQQPSMTAVHFFPSPRKRSLFHLKHWLPLMFTQRPDLRWISSLLRPPMRYSKPYLSLLAEVSEALSVYTESHLPFLKEILGLPKTPPLYTLPLLQESSESRQSHLLHNHSYQVWLPLESSSSLNTKLLDTLEEFKFHGQSPMLLITDFSRANRAQKEIWARPLRSHPIFSRCFFPKAKHSDQAWLKEASITLMTELDPKTERFEKIFHNLRNSNCLAIL